MFPPQSISSRLSDYGKTKTIKVWANGDHKCHVFHIHPKKFCSWDIIMNHISEKILPTFGAIKTLVDLKTNKKITSFDELEPHMKYVAVGAGCNAVKIPSGGYRTNEEINKEAMKKVNKTSSVIKGVRVNESGNFLKETGRNRNTVIYFAANGRPDTPKKGVFKEDELTNYDLIRSYIAKMLKIPDGIRYFATSSGIILEDTTEFQHGSLYVAVPFGENFIRKDYIGLFRKKYPFVNCTKPNRNIRGVVSHHSYTVLAGKIEKSLKKPKMPKTHSEPTKPGLTLLKAKLSQHKRKLKQTIRQENINKATSTIFNQLQSSSSDLINYAVQPSTCKQVCVRNIGTVTSRIEIEVQKKQSRTSDAIDGTCKGFRKQMVAYYKLLQKLDKITNPENYEIEKSSKKKSEKSGTNSHKHQRKRNADEVHTHNKLEAKPCSIQISDHKKIYKQENISEENNVSNETSESEQSVKTDQRIDEQAPAVTDAPRENKQDLITDRESSKDIFDKDKVDGKEKTGHGLLVENPNSSRSEKLEETEIVSVKSDLMSNPENKEQLFDTATEKNPQNLIDQPNDQELNVQTCKVDTLEKLAAKEVTSANLSAVRSGNLDNVESDSNKQEMIEESRGANTEKNPQNLIDHPNTQELNEESCKNMKELASANLSDLRPNNIDNVESDPNKQEIIEESPSANTEKIAQNLIDQPNAQDINEETCKVDTLENLAAKGLTSPNLSNVRSGNLDNVESDPYKQEIIEESPSADIKNISQNLIDQPNAQELNEETCKVDPLEKLAAKELTTANLSDVRSGNLDNVESDPSKQELIEESPSANEQNVKDILDAKPISSANLASLSNSQEEYIEESQKVNELDSRQNEPYNEISSKNLAEEELMPEYQYYQQNNYNTYHQNYYNAYQQNNNYNTSDDQQDVSWQNNNYEVEKVDEESEQVTVGELTHKQDNVEVWSRAQTFNSERYFEETPHNSNNEQKLDENGNYIHNNTKQVLNENTVCKPLFNENTNELQNGVYEQSPINLLQSELKSNENLIQNSCDEKMSDGESLNNQITSSTEQFCEQSLSQLLYEQMAIEKDVFEQKNDQVVNREMISELTSNETPEENNNEKIAQDYFNQNNCKRWENTGGLLEQMQNENIENKTLSEEYNNNQFDVNKKSSIEVFFHQTISDLLDEKLDEGKGFEKNLEQAANFDETSRSENSIEQPQNTLSDTKPNLNEIDGRATNITEFGEQIYNYEMVPKEEMGFQEVCKQNSGEYKFETNLDQMTYKDIKPQETAENEKL